MRGPILKYRLRYGSQARTVAGMNTYRALPTGTGHWVVGWWTNNMWQGPSWGTFPTEAEAAFCAFEFARMEWQEASRPPDKNPFLG